MCAQSFNSMLNHATARTEGLAAWSMDQIHHRTLENIPEKIALHLAKFYHIRADNALGSTAKWPFVFCSLSMPRRRLDMLGVKIIHLVFIRRVVYS